MKKKDAIKWTTALRSDKYKQGKEMLYDGYDKSYCCLGVLDKINPKLNLAGSSPYQVLDNYAKIGLNSDCGYIPELDIDLTVLNDGIAGYPQLSFDEIADIIEIVYVHGME